MRVWMRGFVLVCVDLLFFFFDSAVPQTLRGGL